jgi:hypothetical protein
MTDDIWTLVGRPNRSTTDRNHSRFDPPEKSCTPRELAAGGLPGEVQAEAGERWHPRGRLGANWASWCKLRVARGGTRVGAWCEQGGLAMGSFAIAAVPSLNPESK